MLFASVSAGGVMHATQHEKQAKDIYDEVIDGG